MIHIYVYFTRPEGGGERVTVREVEVEREAESYLDLNLMVAVIQKVNKAERSLAVDASLGFVALVPSQKSGQKP